MLILEKLNNKNYFFLVFISLINIPKMTQSPPIRAKKGKRSPASLPNIAAQTGSPE